jgi:hypothetical protein
MSSKPPQPPGGNPENPPPPDPPGTFTQQIQHSQVGARVPEKVARGSFSTGVIVLQGAHEFILDFLLRMSQPHQVSARVIMSPAIVPGFIAALRENLGNYQNRFGPPKELPPPPPGATAPPLEEIYSQLKLPDDMLGGVYANTVMIAHTPSEFCFDFITNCYPRPVVSCRVYLSAPQVPALLNTLTRSFQQYQQRQQTQQPPRPPEPPPLTN